jgi:hypothetical protein
MKNKSFGSCIIAGGRILFKRHASLQKRPVLLKYSNTFCERTDTMESYSLILDVVVLGLGIYLIMLAMKAKKTGDVHKTLMWRTDESFSRCRDKEGYIKYVCPRAIVSGAVLAVVGLACVIRDFLKVQIPYIDTINIVSCILVIIYYCYFASKAMKLYFYEQR